MDRLSEALDHCTQGYAMAIEVSNVDAQFSSCQCLYMAYKKLENKGKALEFFELCRLLEDSLQQTEMLTQLQFMEFENQMVIDGLAQVERDLLKQIEFDKEVQRKTRSRNILIAVVILILIFSIGLTNRLLFIRKSRNRLEKEKDRSEQLLLNILPAEVAEELKNEGKSDARDFVNVSILFTDFAQFTDKATKLSAKELVKEVNACFMAFDQIIEKYKIEKIKTIGDAYMATGGLHSPRTSETQDVVMTDLETQDFIIRRKFTLATKGMVAFEMRVGIHTGPVVAGIVGVKKFQYDIWGDTVNTASRMESNCGLGKVNISNDTYMQIKDNPLFVFENREEVEVKGKGKMQMHYVMLANL